MPTYDYACRACGHRFEEFQSMSSDPLKKCPACKKNRLERLIGTGAAVISKGSGFYETDYRGDGYAQDAKKDSESSDAGAKDSADGCTPTSGSDDAPSGGATPSDGSDA